VRVELRYRGVRAPHKLKAAVSGCVRECAEAQSKDFGLIATEKGWNLYVCGNGGANPRHADLLAADLDEETAIKSIDRFIMYYIQTADRLTRTSVWLEKMEGGIDYLRDVIINDRLGICEELERQMQFLVGTYTCEWKAVVDDPEKRRLFQQFANADETESCVEFVTERGQQRPAGWRSDFVSLDQLKSPRGKVNGYGHAHEHEHARPADQTEWVMVGKVSDFPVDGGGCIKYGQTQIAVFRFDSRGEWYACQNMCPHKKELVLSRGLIGDQNGVPKVACPLHKKTFSLKSGTCLSGEDYHIQVFPVKVEGDEVYLELPSAEKLDESLYAWTSCAVACV
jgi:nitrite reductase (NADH) large subunit